MVHFALTSKDHALPRTREDFEAQPTAKLQALAKLVVHHLTSPKAQPLRNKDGQQNVSVDDMLPFAQANELEEDVEFEYAQYEEGPPDKIIIFSLFPANNVVLENVRLSV